jgi:uncharacterized membrane protein
VDTPSKINGSDVAEMLMGAVALAYPVAVTEEVWDLGVALPAWKVLSLWICSGIVIGWYGTHRFQGGAFRKNWGRVVLRVGVVQLLTFCVCALLLGMLDKFPLLTDPAVALNRAVLVLFPAAFSATIVDGLN